jgi:hypothetical protein
MEIAPATAGLGMISRRTRKQQRTQGYDAPGLLCILLSRDLGRLTEPSTFRTALSYDIYFYKLLILNRL